MLESNLRLLAQLYYRPSRALGRILDEGSLLFGAVAVLVVSLLTSLGTLIPMYAAVQAQPGTVPAARPGSPDAASLFTQGLMSFAASSVILSLVGLALLYVPACILAMTALAPVGSFGVAFRRDYGSLLACALFSWAAAGLPFALLGLALPGGSWAARFGLAGAGVLVFALFMVLALRTVFGVHTALAALAALLGVFGLLLAPIAPLLASPFLLYLGWQYFRGDIADVQWVFGRRQSFKRHLHAATLNPRDAEAHYQLGLIHQQRREIPEAIERFRKAVEIDPGEVDAHYQLGRLAREQKRFDDAIRHFEEVVKRSDTHAHHEVWREIGATYVASGSLSNARWALDKFVERRPHDPEGLLLRGEAQAAAGDTEAAQESFRRCIEAVDTMPAYRRHEVSRFRALARKRLRA